MIQLVMKQVSILELNESRSERYPGVYATISDAENRLKVSFENVSISKLREVSGIPVDVTCTMSAAVLNNGSQMIRLRDVNITDTFGLLEARRRAEAKSASQSS